MAGGNGTLDSFDGANYFGIEPSAMPAWRALAKAQDDNEYYPCLNNPYFYTDYDGFGFETEERGGASVGLSEDDCEALCFGCPLLKQCYDFAIANGEDNGIWGGIDFSRKVDTLF